MHVSVYGSVCNTCRYMGKVIQELCGVPSFTNITTSKAESFMSHRRHIYWGQRQMWLEVLLSEIWRGKNERLQVSGLQGKSQMETTASSPFKWQRIFWFHMWKCLGANTPGHMGWPGKMFLALNLTLRGLEAKRKGPESLRALQPKSISGRPLTKKVLLAVKEVGQQWWAHEAQGKVNDSVDTAPQLVLYSRSTVLHDLYKIYSNEVIIACPGCSMAASMTK